MGFKKKHHHWVQVTEHGELRKGVSILEFLVAFGVFGVISIMVASVYFAHFRLFSNQNSVIDVSTQARIAVDEIIQQVKQSESIVASCTPCGSDVTNANTVILRLWPIDASGEPIDPSSTNYDYIVFKRETPANRLVKITYPNASSIRTGGTHAVSSYISGLTFEYDNATPANATEITVTVNTSTTNLDKTVTSSEKGKAILRNK